MAKIFVGVFWCLISTPVYLAIRRLFSSVSLLVPKDWMFRGRANPWRLKNVRPVLLTSHDLWPPNKIERLCSQSQSYTCHMKLNEALLKSGVKNLKAKASSTRARKCACADTHTQTHAHTHKARHAVSISKDLCCIQLAVSRRALRRTIVFPSRCRISTKFYTK